MNIINSIKKKIILYRFKRLKNKNFSIICNNCWAGNIYQATGIKYLTPTIGLFFYMPCYIKFLENFNYYLNVKLRFIKQSKYEIVNNIRRKEWYPIADLGGIEIQFLHYNSEEDANNKWEKRKKRINKDNLLFVGSERDLCTEKLIRRYQNLPFKNKLFFTANRYDNDRSLIQIKEFENEKIVGDIWPDQLKIYKYFNVLKWIEEKKIYLTYANQ